MTRVLWLAVLVCVVQCLPMSQDELEDFSNFLLKTSSLDLHVKSADPDDSYDDDELVSEHAWEESGKFEGDLILNDRQRRLIVENVEGLSRNGLTDSTKRWPNNEVIYFIQREHFTSGQVQAIQDGIDDLAQASCVKFRPYRKGDRDAVVIQGSRRGCFSQVGYQGGYQVLNLSGRHPVGRGCFRHGTVVHELLHSLGFYHMQSSPDRDDYIDVVWANIVQPARHNFRKYNSFSVSDFGVGYDYDSVLHYSRRAFSANGQDTLVPKKSGAEIGQRVGLSDKDTQKLNKMYCDADNDPAVQAEETTKKPKNKKKKPKNLPFEGHGIGYHQGKTVVIKLPAAETYKLSNVPSTNVFDFSKTPQVVPPEAEGYRFGEEVTYSYNPTTSVNVDTIRDYDIQKKPIVNKSIEKLDFDDKTDPQKGNKDGNLSPHHQNQVKPEYIPIDDYDKDLKDAFDRLNKIVQQHIYPQSKGYNHKINKDYSKFFVPLNPEHKETSKDYTSDNVDPPILYETTKVTPLKLMDITHTSDDKTTISQIQDRIDSSFRTSLPTKKPYHSFEQTETPNYATLDYLKNRHNFSDIYTPQYHDTRIAQNDEITSTYDQNYKDDIKINPHQQGFYTDGIKNIGVNLKTTPTYNNAYTDANFSKYEGNDNPKQLQIERDVDYTYRILLPTKKPYSAYHHIDAPNYATLEYLKDRNDISNIYPPKKLEEENKKITYNVPQENNPPTDGNWYTGDSYKNNPANYDQNSYSEYVQSKSKEDSNDSYEDNKKPSDSVDAIKNEPKKDTFYSKYSNEHEVATPDKTITDDKSKESSQLEKPEYNEEDYDYYENDREDENKGSYKENSNEYSTKSPNHSKESLKYNSDYSSEAEAEQNTSAIKSSQEDEKSEESPKKTQAYTLYSVPVPLTKDWFKISYTIPETRKGDKHFT